MTWSEGAEARPEAEGDRAMFVAAFVLTATASSSTATERSTAAEHATTFRARWRPELHSAVADASIVNAANVQYPKHCKLAVVGAGWGGAYTAWRLAVDTKTIDPSGVCVFEGNGRVGGRIYSIHGLPHFADLAVDVGGYRFQETQRLPADLVWSGLKMPTVCYDWGCAAKCEGTTCFVIKDAYGNNEGYASVIERMLGEVEAAGGPGTQVYFATKLESISAAAHVGKAASTLHFAGGATVTADKVVLNLPANAIENLASSSTIFAGSKHVNSLLDSVYVNAMVKVYAWYDDAWWNTKLGLMEGYFTGHGGKEHKFAAPLEGRYHDGPQRCIIGKDTTGMPVYAGYKIKQGNCSGALEVFYGRGQPYYKKLMASPLQPLTVVTADGVSPPLAEEGGVIAARTLLSDVHEHLMSHHATKLTAAGIDPETVPPPKTVVLGNWIHDGKYTPGIGFMWGGNATAKAAVRKPVPQYDLFVANQDYGYQSGWAVGSLTMAEKILQAEMGLPKPAWLNGTWYEDRVLSIP